MCLECDPLRTELERIRPLAREAEKLRMKLAKAEEHLLAQTEAQNATAKELAKVRRELAVEEESSPAAKIVREVLDFWAEDHPGANVSGQGARAKLVRAAVRLGHTNPKIPCPVHPDDGSKPDRQARCTIADELKEAVEFIRLKPFVGQGGRTGACEPGTRRFDGIEYALTEKRGQSRVVSEAAIEKCRRDLRVVRASRVERLRAAVEAAQNVEQSWFRLWMEAAVTNGNGGNGEKGGVA